MFMFLFSPRSSTFPFQMLTFVCPPRGGLQTVVGSQRHSQPLSHAGFTWLSALFFDVEVSLPSSVHCFVWPFRKLSSLKDLENWKLWED